jgi:alpha-aminoadipate carrier protein LysW
MTAKPQAHIAVACPLCESPVIVPDDAVEGEVLACGACAAELEVVGLDPLELAEAPEVSEDWGE